MHPPVSPPYTSVTDTKSITIPIIASTLVAFIKISSLILMSSHQLSRRSSNELLMVVIALCKQCSGATAGTVECTTHAPHHPPPVTTSVLSARRCMCYTYFTRRCMCCANPARRCICCTHPARRCMCCTPVHVLHQPRTQVHVLHPPPHIRVYLAFSLQGCPSTSKSWPC